LENWKGISLALLAWIVQVLLTHPTLHIWVKLVHSLSISHYPLGTCINT